MSTSNKNEKGILKLLLFVYKKYYKETGFKWQVWSYILLQTINGLYPLLISYLLAKVVDKTIFAINNSGTLRDVVPLIIILACVSVLWTFLTNLFQYVENSIELWVSYLEDSVYIKKYIEIEPQAYENPSFVNEKGVLSWNSYKVKNRFFQALDVLALIPVIIISFFAIYSQIPLLSLLAVLATIPNALILKKFGSKIWGIWGDKGEEKIKYSSYKGFLWGSKFEKLQEIYVFKYGQYLFDKAMQINKRFIDKFQKNYIKRYSWSTVASFLSGIISIFVVIFSIKMVFDGNLTVGMLTFVIAAYQRFNGNVSSILYGIYGILGDKKFFQIFYNILNWKNSIINGETILDNIGSGISIEFRNVWFKYPKTKKWIIKDMSFKMKEDEDIAIVGKNGAGKTTIVKLILRIYDPQKGEILINGINIKDLDLDSYYKLVGILSQSFNQINITVKDNIFIGDISKNIDNKIQEAAKNADIHQSIMGLPLKYDTFLSRDIKGGMQLSGGQWQKLAIARAFFRDPKLLILDEPTSAVDSISEEKIFENIRKNAEHRTTIIVSHRFATVRKADRILVIDNGEIIEDGNHSRLMEDNGLYAEMYNKQVG